MGLEEQISSDLFNVLPIMVPETSFQQLLKQLPVRPIAQENVAALVKSALKRLPAPSSPENRRSQWEYTLRKALLNKTMQEDDALASEDTHYYDELGDLLDVVLTFTEQSACDSSFPLLILQDLFETHTIASCSHIFAWMESRTARLTHDLIPQKGRGLIILRTLNDLLRRLPKMGSTNIFCGRILAFLSGILPLGERSAVNLRGEYGPAWEGVVETHVPPKTEDTMDIDAPAKEESFYQTFWSLQHYFSRPSMFATPSAFGEFKDAVNKVLPMIKEATAKERAMMGSRSNASAASLKVKREPEPAFSEEPVANEYFFAKFLTSPDLLDLEMADTHFRRQILFQLLILLHHLLTFTKAAKATWVTGKSRPLQMEFTLEPAEATWCTETVAKAFEELKSTAPNGRAFAETVQVILEREQNWVKWKTELCPPFDKAPWSETTSDGRKVGLEEATAPLRKKMMEPPEEWKWKMGTEALTEVFEMGYRGLEDLEHPFQRVAFFSFSLALKLTSFVHRAGDIKDFVKKIKQEDARIEMRQKALTRIAQAKAAAAAPPPPPPPPVTPKMEDIVMTSTPMVSSPAGTDMAISPLPPSRTHSASNLLNHPLPMKPGSSSGAGTPSKKAFEVPEVVAPVPMLAVIAPPVAHVPAPLPAPAPVLPAVVAPVGPPDSQIARFEENKQRWSWLALRTMRDTHLRHYSGIGTGDVLKLAALIQQEKDGELKVEDSTMMTSSISTGSRLNEAADVAPPGVGNAADDKMEVSS